MINRSSIVETYSFDFSQFSTDSFKNVMAVAMYSQIIIVNILICRENMYQS